MTVARAINVTSFSFNQKINDGDTKKNRWRLLNKAHLKYNRYRMIEYTSINRKMS